MSPRASVGGALFGALLVATLLAAVLVVRARDPDLELEVTELACDPPPCLHRTARTFSFDPVEQVAQISFFVRESDPEAFVGIVDEDDELVRTLEPGAPLERDEGVVYTWDGRDDTGALVAPESYYLRVELPSRDRDMVWPRRIKVLPAGTEAQGGG